MHDQFYIRVTIFHDYKNKLMLFFIRAQKQLM